MKKVKILTVLSMFFLLLVVGGCGKKEYTVTFNTAGGSKIESVKVKENEKLKEPDEPTRKGYTFEGWELDGEEFDFDTKITKDITLKATWKASIEKFTVTFDSNGGSEVDSIRVKKNEKVAKPNDPIKDGHIFVRWELDGTAFDFESAVTKDITLKAVWSEIPKDKVSSTSKPSIKAEDLKQLKELIEQAGALLEADYTEESWNALNFSLNLKETTQKEVTTKINAIKEALANLVLQVEADLKEIKDAIAELEIAEAEFTSASWAEYQTALAAANLLPESTEEEMAAKTEAYIGALAKLVLTKQADLTAKQAEIEALPEADYTTSSWTTFQTELERIALMLEETNEEIQAKIDAYDAAIDALVLKVKEELDTIKTKADNLKEADYSIASWVAYQQALAAITNMPETTKAEITAKIEAYETAFNALVLVKKADLDTKKQEANAYQSNDYTAESWQQFLTAMSEADLLPETTNAEIEAKIAKYNEAIAKLVMKETAELAKVKEQAGALLEAEYTNASWTEYQAALATAEALPETTKAEMTAKIEAYKAAFAKLVLTKKSDLDTKEAEMTALQENDYTVASWTEYQTALATAQTLPETTNAEIEAKIAKYNEAIAKLVLQAKADLDAKKTEIANLQETDYTAASWVEYQTALTTANNLPETTKAEMTAKTAKYDEAIAKLVLVKKADLDAKKAEITALQENDYTVASWTEYQTALATVQTLPETTNAEIETKIAKYNEAIAKLVLQAKADLDAKKEEMRTLRDTDYTAVSWSEYQGALMAAQDLPETTKEEMEAKIVKYDEALAELVLQAKVDLDAKKAEIAALVEAEYTVESWTQYQAALTTANNLPETTKAEMTAKIAKYDEAIAKLVTV